MNHTLFLIIGYVVFTLYTVGIMLLGEIIERKAHVDKLICRKITHIVSAFVWVICYFFFGCSIHWVILNGVGAVLLGFVVFGNASNAYEREDAKKSYGLFLYGACTFINALVCYLISKNVYYINKIPYSILYLYNGIAYFCLALGDGFAPILAKLLKKYNVTIMESRSLIGSLTVFTLSFFVTLAFSLIFKLQLSFPFMLSVAGLTCVAEFYGLKGLDNLLIDFFVFGYMLLYYFGLVSVTLQIVCILSPFLAIAAVKAKSLSPSGGFAAFIVWFLTALFGRSYVPILFMTSLFMVSAAVSVITNKLYFKGANEETTKQARNLKQVLSVVLTAILCLIIYYFTHVQIFYMLFYLCLTGQFADSMASDIGRLTKKQNIDILKFKPVEKGISGGISLLGTTLALFSSFVFMLIPFLLRVVNVRFFLSISLLAFVGTLIDSVLGSLGQALFRCEVCGKQVEGAVHCDAPSTLIKGWKWLKNTEVNLLTSVITCILGIAIFLL